MQSSDPIRTDHFVLATHRAVPTPLDESVAVDLGRCRT